MLREQETDMKNIVQMKNVESSFWLSRAVLPHKKQAKISNTHDFGILVHNFLTTAGIITIKATKEMQKLCEMKSDPNQTDAEVS